MSQWTDRSSVLSISDLSNIESEITRVAADEAVDINAIIVQAQSECGDKILELTQKFSNTLSNGATSLAHNLAVNNWGPSTGNRNRIRLGQIVGVDFQRSAMTTWILYETLSLFYRTCAGRAASMDDRYRTKFKQYADLVENKYYPRFFTQGVPIVNTPLPCPGAVGERGSGVFGSGNVSSAVHAGPAGGTYDVSISWVAIPTYQGPQANKKNNGESAPSATVTQDITSGHVLSVSIVGLTPPDGNALPWSQGQAFVANGVATHWNLYVGANGGTQYLQNASPTPLATTSLTLSADPLLSGYSVDSGQYFDQNLFVQNVLRF